MTAPTSPSATLDAETIAELNALLHLDLDAIQAYGVAVQRIANVGRRETVNRFRGDRERNVAALTRLIRHYGGTPVDAAGLAAGRFERAIRLVDADGGESEILVAFKASTRRSRDAYARAAERGDALPSDVGEVLRAAADDEARHYDWAREQLATLGVGLDGAARRAASAAERVRVGVTDGAQRLGTRAQRGVDAAREGLWAARERLPDGVTDRALVVGVGAAVVGFVLTVALASTLRKR